ncbi:MazG nucleotide pyrophosphohydrolase domain-containing protein [Flavobacterium caseinilyticum]|uniref:NTP pyrophosphohydrolase MazG-like domain-containing protein n=1 Tax=Flavobacterium caseinilyticum TaxID=2541732 RepID=A0A4R5B236_9FLAO|nr:MazG nucleotide pyrophosphohydrolase domain-containing protein [Flavobacterium caseinilyticum]TDD77102.1 hypothetical protein E0F89_05755 [Flavobacterium caseinilyticum]
MNENKVRQTLQEAIHLWGNDAQIKLLHEEIGELMQAISKQNRKPNPENFSHLCEEIADVKIMLSQLELITDPDAVADHYYFKMQRLQRRIADERTRRLENIEKAKSQIDPEKYKLFALLCEIGTSPLDSQIDELIAEVKEYSEIKKEQEFNNLF